jgi:hypothetical protein
LEVLTIGNWLSGWTLSLVSMATSGEPSDSDYGLRRRMNMLG